MKLLHRFREIGDVEDLSLFLIRNSNVDQYLISDLLKAGFKSREIIETGLNQCLNTFAVYSESRRDLCTIFHHLCAQRLPITKANLNKFAHLSKSARVGFGYQTLERFLKAYRDEIASYHFEIGY